MLFHLTIFFWSIAFFSGMAAVTLREDIPFWTGYLFSAAFLSIVSLFSAKRITKRLRNSFIPLLLAISAPAILSLIDQPTHKIIFSVIASGMYYFAFLGLYRLRFAPNDLTARSFLSIAMLSALFFFYSAIVGFYLNFAFPLWMFMLAYLLGTLGAAYQSLYPSLRNDRKKVFFYSLLIALGMSEISWALSFWPWSYLTVGAGSLLFFFMLWDTANASFLGTVSRKRTLLYLLVTLGLVALLVATSPWMIQV